MCIGGQRLAHQVVALRAVQAQAGAGGMDAGQQAQQVNADRQARRLVEVVQIEIDQAVAPAKAAEVLQVQVAADPAQRRGRQGGKIYGAMAQHGRGPQEREGILRHGAELVLQKHRYAARVDLRDQVDGVASYGSGSAGHCAFGLPRFAGGTSVARWSRPPQSAPPQAKSPAFGRGFLFNA